MTDLTLRILIDSAIGLGCFAALYALASYVARQIDRLKE